MPKKTSYKDKLLKSDFYKNLPPDSGRSFRERLAERYKPSPNMYDMTGPGFNREVDPMLNPAIVGDKKLPDKIKPPPERPNPSQEKKTRKRPKLDDFMKKNRSKNNKTHNNLVTPGKWETR